MSVAGSALRAQSTGGAVAGLRRDGHVAFLGVPYAGAPVGRRRFGDTPPRPSWSGVRDATAPGAVAPQDPLVPFPFRADGPESEDCLFLNVFTPAADNGSRPVLFWIHGGGFSHGAGSQAAYDGGRLAHRGDVVVVTINYRVGALGYLYLGGHGGDEWGAVANAGQRDQVAALEWVRDNIAAFGGDPSRVTIAGQSAGSVAVNTLLAMPSARGLFAQAIAQSGTAGRLGGTELGEAVAGAYLNRLGVPDADPKRLQSVAVSDLLAAQGSRGALSPVVDGATLPEHPGVAIADGVARDVALMVGHTRDEQNLYVAADRAPIDDDTLREQVRRILPRRSADRADEVVEVYRASRAERGLRVGNHDIVDALGTASRFRMPALRLAESQGAHRATFVYQFDWESPARRGAMGARHGLEIPFVFGAIDGADAARTIGEGPAVRLLSAQMMDAWIAFVRTGDPSHDGIGQWAPYDERDRTTMVFGPSTGAQEAPFEEERSLWASLMATPPRLVAG